MRTHLFVGAAGAVLGVAITGALLQCTSSSPTGWGGSGSPGPTSTGPSPGSVSSFGGTLTTTWQGQLSSDQPLDASAIAVDNAGHAVIVGTLRGSSQVGYDHLMSAGGADVFVAKLDESGHPLWAKRFGDASDQVAYGVAIDSNGDIVLAGEFAGTIDFSSGPTALTRLTASSSNDLASREKGVANMQGRAMSALGSTDAFVAALDSSGGFLWSTHLGASGAASEARSVAVGPNGFVVAGSFEKAIAFDTEIHFGAGGTDAFVGWLDRRGQMLRVNGYGGPGDDRATSVAADAFGRALVTGTFGSTIDVGTGTWRSNGALDVFVAMLEPGGKTLWSKAFGGPKNDDAVAVAFDSHGDAITLGNYSDTVDLGTGPMRTYGVPDCNDCGLGWDVFVAKYGVEGNAKWVRQYGSADLEDRGDALAVDANGYIFVSGHVRDGISFGGCFVTANTAVVAGQAFLGEIDPNGNGVCVAHYGFGTWAQIRSLAAGPTKDVLMTGAFEGTLNPGGGTLTSRGSRDAFMAHVNAPPPVLF